jgi:phosphoribosyl 1,2-cyclic phosphodiesterase
MLKNKGLDVTFAIPHVHWDHVQGLPFFGPLYVNKWSTRWRARGGGQAG